MLPGPILIKKCAACTKLIKQETIVSGNTFGAVFWTDGKREAPMMPDQPWLVMCPHCRELLWIDELEQVGEISWEDALPKGRRSPLRHKDNMFEDALPFKVPSMRNYFAILKRGAETPEKEKYLRLRAWWAGNDSRRDKKTNVKLSASEASNLTAFVEMLNESDANERLMKAEALRELGLFAEAKKLLTGRVDAEILQVTAIIKKLITKRDPYVRRMDFR